MTGVTKYMTMKLDTKKKAIKKIKKIFMVYKTLICHKSSFQLSFKVNLLLKIFRIVRDVVFNTMKFLFRIKIQFNVIIPMYDFHSFIDAMFGFNQNLFNGFSGHKCNFYSYIFNKSLSSFFQRFI